MVEAIKPDQLLNAVTVILAIFAAIVAVDKFVDVIKKWKAPEKDVAEKLRADKLALERHDADIKALKEGQKAMCKGVVALLDHELHNGNSKQMEDARSEISKYLTDRI
jgi:hypothetical protein